MSQASYGKRDHPVDHHVGMRIRQRRRSLGLGQETLAARLGVSFQQMQKYERGLNRISASRLHAIATVLGVGLDDFFDGLALDDEAPPAAAFLGTPDGLALASSFLAIPDARKRRALVELVRVCAAAD